MAAVSVVVGLIAALWQSEVWAGVLGAAVTAVASAGVVAAQTEWQQQAEMVRRRPRALAVATPAGRFPLVRDLHDPVAVGVHPAEAIEQAGTVDRVPTYVTRDIDSKLHAVLRRAGFVLLVGESTAGKTRSAFEAIKLLQPDSHFVAPSTREALEVLLEGWGTVGRCVVWLDDLERFLGPGGLTPSTLHRLLALDSQVIILATMRSHEYDRYRDRAETEASGAAQEVWRQGRAVLRQAQVVHVERRWTAAERNRARSVSSDTRLVRALTGSERFGVAEILAAGPELAEVWQHAWIPGHHPRGAALVAAAVDARRAGYHRPLPIAVLQRLHDGYLARRGGMELRAESFQDALSWALTPTVPAGANSLLLGSDEGGYIAFDYLIDLPVLEDIPEMVWAVVMELAPAHEAYTIACNAWLAGSYIPAIQALQRAAQAGIGESERILLEAGVPIRSAEEALAFASQRWQTLRRDLGEDHEDCLMAKSLVASFTLHCGRYDEALLIYEELTGRAASILGDEHPLVLGLRFGFAFGVFASGSREEGLVLLDAAVQDGMNILGSNHVAVLDRRKWVVRVLVESRRIADARQRFSVLQSDCSQLPAAHPIAVEVAHLADLLRQESQDSP